VKREREREREIKTITCNLIPYLLALHFASLSSFHRSSSLTSSYSDPLRVFPSFSSRLLQQIFLFSLLFLACHKSDYQN